MDQHGRGSLSEGATRLSDAYRTGQASTGQSLAAYVAARLPATYAVNARVLAEVAELLPGFAPQSLVDVGCGPGTAGWAALSQWPAIEHLTQVERDETFAELAQTLAARSNLPALMGSTMIRRSLTGLTLPAPLDMVVASYVLAELADADVLPAAQNLWAITGQVLVLIEPGTPKGFERLRRIRTCLQGEGASVVAPCTHQQTCPMQGADWCHFKERVQRSRAHMHAKKADVPYEDEPFSYLVLARTGMTRSRARVIASPAVEKAGIRLRLCAADGISNVTIAKRDKPAFKRARHVRWGDTWDMDHNQ
jgi:ribosomal protein RSM22 (predicted rRNA methylase)